MKNIFTTLLLVPLIIAIGATAQILPSRTTFKFSLGPDGLLLVKLSSSPTQTFSVCDDGFAATSAQALCHMARADAWTGASFRGKYGNSSYPIALRYVRCPADATNFHTQCSFIRSGTGCAFYEQVHLNCVNKTNVEFALMQPGSILLARPVASMNADGTANKPGPWGTVYLYDFTSSGTAASLSAAQGICHLLGLPYEAADYTSSSSLTNPVDNYTARSEMPFYLSNLRCSDPSTVQNFHRDCTYDMASGYSSPSHRTDTVLLCQHRKNYHVRLASNDAVVEVRPSAGSNASTANGIICAYGSTSTSTLQYLCATLGLPSTDVGYRSASAPSPDTPIYIRDLVCPVPPSSSTSSSSSSSQQPDGQFHADLSNCTYRQTNLSCTSTYGGAIGLTCLEKRNYKFRLDPTTNVLLAKPIADGSGSNSNNNNDAEGYVCAGSTFSSSSSAGGSMAAQTVCRLLGLPFTGATFARYVPPSPTTTNGGNDDQFPYKPILNQWYCSRYAKNFSECRYSAANIHNYCNGAVQISCSESQLVGFDIQRSGYVAIYKLDTPAVHAAACRTGMSTTTARTLCRLANLPYSSTSYGSTYSSAAAIITNIQCPATASNFSTDCSYDMISQSSSSSTSTYCSASSKLQLFCRGSPPPTFEIKLDPQNRLLYRASKSDTFGSVAACSASNYVARSVCRQLAGGDRDSSSDFSSAVISALPHNESLYTQKIFSPSCMSTSTGLANGCTLSGYTTSRCNSDLAIYCNPQMEFMLSPDNYLIVRPALNAPWAPIAYSTLAAQPGVPDLMCRLLGFGKTAPFGQVFQGKVNASTIPGGGGASITSPGSTTACSASTFLSCPSTATTFNDCKFSTSTPSCYSAHLGLRCFSSPSSYAVRIEPKTNLVQIRRSPSSADSWTYICNLPYSTPGGGGIPIPEPRVQQQQQQPQTDGATTATSTTPETAVKSSKNSHSNTNTNEKILPTMIPLPTVTPFPMPPVQTSSGMAQVLCRSMGLPYSGAYSKTPYSTSDGALYTYGAQILYCSFPYGTKINNVISNNGGGGYVPSLTNNCTIIGPSNLNKCYASQLFCRDRTEYKFSLSPAGLVLVQPANDPTKPPGTLCDDGLSVSTQQLCQLAGAPTSLTTRVYGVYGAKSMPIYLQSLSCNYYATNASGCTYVESNYSCTHYEDVAVSCKEKTNYKLSIAGGGDSGLLLLQPIAANGTVLGPMGGACSRGFCSNAAAAICRLLNKPYAAATWTTGTANTPQKMPIYVEYVSCGDVKQFSDCYYRDASTDCNNDDLVVITCRGDVRYNFTVEDQTHLLLARPVGAADTAPFDLGVCTTSFSSVDAFVACSSNNLPASLNQCSYSSRYSSTINAGITSMSCVSSYTNLSQCAYKTAPSPRYCTNFVALYCRGALPPGMQFRLSPTKYNGSSRVEVRFASWKPFQPLCSNHFSYMSTNSKLAMAKFLNMPVSPLPSSFPGDNIYIQPGMNILTYTVPYAAAASGSMPSALSYFYCSDPSDSSTCQAHADSSQTCDDGIGIISDPVFTFSFFNKTNVIQVTPRSASNPKISAPPGFVCGSGGASFSRRAAQAICKSMGLPWQGAIEYEERDQQQLPAGMNPYIQAMDCPSGSSDLSSCVFSAASHCSHSRPMAVRCYPARDVKKWELRLANITNDNSNNNDFPPPYPYPPSQQTKINPLAKLVEIRRDPSEPWSAVCSRDFPFASAATLCSMLNLPSSGASYLEVSTKLPYLISRLSCPSGAKSIADCEFSNSTQYCYDGGALALICKNRDVYEFRLGNDKGSSNNNGGPIRPPYPGGGSSGPTRWPILQARIKGSNDAFGSVCGLGFSQQTAAVTCTMLGYPSTGANFVQRSAIDPYMPYDSSPILPGYGSSTPILSYLDCPSGTTDPSKCSYRESSFGCSSHNDIVLFCNPSIPTLDFTINASSGAVVLTPNSTGPIGVICSQQQYWHPYLEPAEDLVAQQLCAMKSLPTTGSMYSPLPASAAATVAAFGGSTPYVYISNITCSGSAQKLTDCDFQYNNVGCSQDGLQQQQPAYGTYFGVLCRDKTEFEMKINPLNDALMLKPLDVRNASWGTACGLSIRTSTAQSLCRILGLPFSAATASYTKTPGGDDMPVYIKNLVCPDTAKSLYQCRYVEQVSQDRTCMSHNYDLQLKCRSAPAYQFSLASDNKLLVRQNDSSPWAPICYVSNGNQSASALAAFVGIAPAGAYLLRERGDTADQINGKWKLSQLSCPSFARKTSDCSSYDTTYGCSHVMFLFPAATPATPSPPTITLSPNSPPPPPSSPPKPQPQQEKYFFEVQRDGVLRVRASSDSIWRFVCATETAPFSDAAAKAVARALGYLSVRNTRAGIVTVNTSGVKDPAFAIAGVSCDPSDTTHDFANCNISYSMLDIPSSCNSNTAVAVYTNSNEFFKSGLFFTLDSGSGILYARGERSTSWSVVDPSQSTSWTASVTSVLCATVGEPSNSPSVSSKPLSYNTTTILDSLQCPVNANNDLTACQAKMAETASSSTATHAAVLSCPAPVTGGYEIRFDSNLRLLLRPVGGSGTWSTISGSFTTESARRICSFAGYLGVSSARWWRVGGFVASTAPPHFIDVSCHSDAANFGDCSRTPAPSTTIHNSDIAIDCSNSFESPVSPPISGAAPETPLGPQSSNNSTSSSNAPNAGDDDDESAASKFIAPIVAVVGVALIAAGAFLYWRRKQQSSSSAGSGSGDYAGPMLTTTATTVTQHQHHTHYQLNADELRAQHYDPMRHADRMSTGSLQQQQQEDEYEPAQV